MFLALSFQKCRSCWKIFPSIPYYLASSSVLKCKPLLLRSKRIPGDENNMGTSRVLSILLFQMKQKQKIVHSSIHDLITDFFANISDQ